MGGRTRSCPGKGWEGREGTWPCPEGRRGTGSSPGEGWEGWEGHGGTWPSPEEGRRGTGSSPRGGEGFNHRSGWEAGQEQQKVGKQSEKNLWRDYWVSGKLHQVFYSDNFIWKEVNVFVLFLSEINH